MKIMVCYNGSDEAKEALKGAKQQAVAFHGEILVVTSVLADDLHYSKLMEPHEEGLKQAQSFFDKNDIPCKTLLSSRGVDTPAGEDLESIAAKEKVDMVVVGIRKRSRVGKLVLGSAAQWLMLNANCLVLGVKKKVANL